MLLKAALVSIFVLPSNMVLDPFGAAGYVSALLGWMVFVVLAAAVLFGLHDPFRERSPARFALALFWLGILSGYASMFGGLSGATTEVGRASADRVLLLVLAMSGVALGVMASGTSMERLGELLRALSVGVVFCALVALLQFSFRVNPADWVSSVMVGFRDNGGATSFQQRGALVRVAGMGVHSIELALAMGMALPYLLWNAVFQPARQRRFWVSWLPVPLAVAAIAFTVSRSGTLALVVAFVVAVPFFPRLVRQWALVAAPAGAAVLFAAVPGLLTTLFGTLTAGTADPSLTTRLNNFPRVMGMVSARPLTGVGPGNYLPSNALEILDNQYLHALVETGIPGLLGTLAVLIIPPASSLVAAIHAPAGALRALAGSTAAAGAVAAAGASTFDGFSFPMFAMMYAVVVGISGAVWRIVREHHALGDL